MIITSAEMPLIMSTFLFMSTLITLTIIFVLFVGYVTFENMIKGLVKRTVDRMAPAESEKDHTDDEQ